MDQREDLFRFSKEFNPLEKEKQEIQDRESEKAIKILENKIKQKQSEIETKHKLSSAIHGLDVAIAHLDFRYKERELKSSRLRQTYQYAISDLKKLREGMTQQDDNSRNGRKISLDKNS